MSGKKLTRRRPRDEEGGATLGDALGRAGKRALDKAAKDKDIVERKGPVQSVRRREQGIRPAKPRPEGEEKVQIDLSGLEELARMDSDDLAALYDAQPLQKTLEEGDRVKATVIRVAGHDVLLDVGAKAEASIDAEEIPDARPGETIEAWVVWSDGEQVRLSTKLQGHLAASFLAEAQEGGIPVEAKVVSASSGGFSVQVGTTHGFVPMSHMDRLRGQDPESYVGKTFSFLVLETGERTVLSRRRLQEAQLADRTEALWATLQEGDVVEGTVTKAMDFGVFVDVDGVEGLLPRSAITSDREADLSPHFPSGSTITVRVTRVDRDAKRISFVQDGRRPQIGEARQRQEAEARTVSSGESSFGTLGDLLGKWKG